MMKWNSEEVVSSYALVVGYLGVLTIITGVITLLPLFVLPFYPKEIAQLVYFVIPGVMAIFIGYVMSLHMKGKRLGQLKHNQELIIVIGAWMIAIFVTAMPFYLTGEYTFSEAIFETTSGWSTTGLSVVDTTLATHIFLLHRTIILFFGGIGLVLVMTSIMSDAYGMRLYHAEGHNDKLLPNLLQSTRLIMGIYSGYIFGGIVLYVFCGMPLFDAICHSVAALSTGGFATHVESIGYYQSVSIEIITIVLMLLGGTNFFVHLLLLKGKGKEVWKHCETKFTMFVIGVVALLMTCILVNGVYSSVSESFRIAIFQVVSAITTTGFQTVPTFQTWSSPLLCLMIIVMLIGGHAGSTAGGLKAYRIYVVYKQVVWYVKEMYISKRTIFPKRIYRYTSYEEVNETQKHSINIYVFVYFMIFIIGSFIFCLYGYSLEDSMFEFSSALSTVGLSVGITGKGAEPVILWVATCGMFLGRLEIFIVFISMVKMIKDGKAYGKQKLRKWENRHEHKY